MIRYREENINIKFARLLRDIGFQASAEIISKGKLPDILVKINGLRVNIEGRFEGTSKKQLKERCKERIEDGICHISVGLIYPKVLRESESEENHRKKIENTHFECFFVSESSSGTSITNLGEADLQEITEKLSNIYNEILDQDLIREYIKKVSERIEEASELAMSNGLFFSSTSVRNKLRKILGIKEKEIKGKIKKDLLKVSFFVIFGGLSFHEVLSGTAEMQKENLNSLRQAPISNKLHFIEKEWTKIKKVNYLPIFNLASSIISCLPSSPESDRIVEDLIDIAIEVVGSGVLLRHDLMGRIYHRLLLGTTAKYYAAYYTSIPAAWLLSNLCIKSKNPELEWQIDSLDQIEDFRVIDPACGSGTLLSGAYGAMKDKYILDYYELEKSQELDWDKFHKTMIEKVLNGWDILDYAGHLTLITLALHNPKSFFKTSNIYILESGETKKGEIRLGSLDFLGEKTSQLPIKGFFGKEYKKKGLEEESIEDELEMSRGQADIVIMNPPFSRSAQPNVKFGYEKDEVKKAMNQQLRNMGKDLGFKRIGRAGLAAYFVILADLLLKNGGRMGLVLPRSTLSGSSWTEIRQKLLDKKYEIEYIVSNYDPGNENIEPWNWSENTNLGEVLIIARKTEKPKEEKCITFVNLWHKPRNSLESLSIVDRVKSVREDGDERKFLEGKGPYKTLKFGKESPGVAYNLSQEYITKSLLWPCIFSYPDLNKLIFELLHNGGLPLISLEQISERRGVDTKQIHNNFKHVDHNTKYPAVWGSPKKIDSILLTDPDYIAPKNSQKADLVYKQKASNLLISERTWNDSAKLIALFSEKPVLATQFWEVVLAEREEEKILSLWLNSTFGFLLFLASGVSNRQDRFTLKKSGLRDMPVLDPHSLSKDQRDNLLNFFEISQLDTFKSFPEEFNLARAGKGLRKRIDKKLIEVLEIKRDLNPYYDMLAEDPIITLERL